MPRTRLNTRRYWFLFMDTANAFLDVKQMDRNALHKYRDAL
ncbi:unnamed protein product [Burkholderia pseudomallei]|nr:unnamed protein product [Burkholderia pseudomallei]